MTRHRQQEQNNGSLQVSTGMTSTTDNTDTHKLAVITSDCMAIPTTAKQPSRGR